MSKLATEVDALIEEHRATILNALTTARAEVIAADDILSQDLARSSRGEPTAGQPLSERLAMRYRLSRANDEMDSANALLAQFVELAKTTGFRERWVRAFNPDHTDDPTMYRALREANIPLHDPKGWYLFLDDERHLSYLGLEPEDNLVLCRSSREAVQQCKDRGGPPSLMFLDHDLGLLYPETGLISRGLDTTMRFLKWATDKYPEWDFDYDVHSMNPQGCLNIRAFLDSFTRSR